MIPDPGGAPSTPFGFLDMNFPAAISSIEGISLPFLAGIKTIGSFTP